MLGALYCSFGAFDIVPAVHAAHYTCTVRLSSTELADDAPAGAMADTLHAALACVLGTMEAYLPGIMLFAEPNPDRAVPPAMMTAREALRRVQGEDDSFDLAEAVLASTGSSAVSDNKSAAAE